MMHQRHRDVLTRNRLLLVRNLKVTNILLSCLREDYTLTDEMEQEIEAEKTNSAKVGVLLDILVRRGHKAFDRFIRALAEADQDTVADALDKDLAKKYITERDSCRMDVQHSSDPNDHSPGLSGRQPTTTWPMAMPQYGMMMMPMMYPMQNMQFPMNGMMMMQQTLPNMTVAGGSAQSHSLMMGNAVAHPSEPYTVSLTKPGSRLTYTALELDAVLSEINGSNVKEIMDIDIQPAANLHEADDPMVYPMRFLPRGHAVIINNRYFVSKMENREGAEHDTNNLRMLFEKLSFSVIVRENLSAQQIRDLLVAESQHQDHAKADAFVLFLLSHGNQGNIYGIDGEKLSIEDEITTLFDPVHCPGLKGKPKIFFIQACQGKLRTFATDSDKDDPPKFPAELDEKLIKKMEKLEIVDKEGFIPGLHKKSDMVMSYATVKGYLAWRRSDVGSWFVRCLVSVFSRRAHSSHLIDMLTEANFLMSHLQTSKQENNSRQLAEKTDTLIKKLYFFPGSGSTSKSDGSVEKRN